MNLGRDVCIPSSRDVEFEREREAGAAEKTSEGSSRAQRLHYCGNNVVGKMSFRKLCMYVIREMDVYKLDL